MNFLGKGIKYLNIYKKYYRRKYQKNFENTVLKYVNDNQYINVERSSCKRYYIDRKLKIIFRMDYRTSYKMGYKNYEQTLECHMKSYLKDYHVIVINLYINWDNPRIDMEEVTQCYLYLMRDQYLKKNVNCVVGC